MATGKLCRKGHPLIAPTIEKQQVDASSGRKRKNKKMQCDECKGIAVYTEFIGCRLCDYDVCSRCMSKAEVAKHDMAALLGKEYFVKDKSISFSCPPGPEVLEGKTLGIFFWSHTCDICEGFAKALAGFYSAWVAKGLDNFEIIAVTDVADDADDDEMAMWAAFQNHGDWYSVPFDAEDVRHRANDWAADILGDSPSGAGPSLIIVGPDGRVVNQRAMLQLSSGVDNILQHTWAPPVVGNLAHGAYSGGADIGTSKALVVLTEACSKKVQEKVAGVLEEVAPGLTRRGILTLHGNKHGAAAGVRPDVLAALGGGCEAWGRGWTARAIRKWTAAANDRCKTPQTVPLMLLIDASEFTDSESRGFYVSDVTLMTAKKANAFVEDVLDDKVERHAFDYAAFTEDFAPLPEDAKAKPQTQPLTGMVTKDGCYVGCTGWDDFGIEGVTGAFNFGDGSAAAAGGGGGGDDAGSDSTSDGEMGEHEKYLRKNLGEGDLVAVGSSDAAAAAAEDDSAADRSPRELRSSNVLSFKALSHEELCETVAKLQETVASQALTIEHLLTRVQAVDGIKHVTFSTPVPAPEHRVPAPQVTSPPPPPLQPRDDDDSTDSDDSEVREYRARQAAKKKATVAAPAATAAAVVKPVAVAAPAAAARSGGGDNSEDEATDSDDSEVREYRARQAAKKAGAAAAKVAPAAVAAPAAAVGGEAKKEEAAATAAAAEAAPEAEARDWNCGRCHGFNWADNKECAHCGNTSSKVPQ